MKLLDSFVEALEQNKMELLYVMSEFRHDRQRDR
jgi:hypothetical protein